MADARGITTLHGKNIFLCRPTCGSERDYISADRAGASASCWIYRRTSVSRVRAARWRSCCCRFPSSRWALDEPEASGPRGSLGVRDRHQHQRRDCIGAAAGQAVRIGGKASFLITTGTAICGQRDSRGCTTDSNHALPIAPTCWRATSPWRRRTPSRPRHDLYPHPGRLAGPGRGAGTVQRPSWAGRCAATIDSALVCGALEMAWRQRMPARA